MPRPIKCRMVASVPKVSYFKPAGIPMYQLSEVELTVEEVEALRLKDTECLDQTTCALQMEVSRSTFQRVLLSARSKIADALLNGKALKITGGNFSVEPHGKCIGNFDHQDPSHVCRHGQGI